MKNVGIALQEYFKTKKFTQRQIADICGVSQPYVARMISGETDFGKNTARKWSEQFGFSYSFLITGEGSLFDNDSSLLHEAVADDLASGIDDNSAEYWKGKYDALLADYNKAQGTIEGLRMALSALGGVVSPSADSEKSVG